MNGVIRDCRHAARLYARTPTASVIAVSVLAVSITFVGAFLSLYVNLALKSSPSFAGSRHLVTVSEINAETTYSLELGLAQRMAEELSSLQALVSIREFASAPIGREGETVNLEYASRGFFDELKPRLALGRGFEPIDHNSDAEPVVVISDHLWRERFDRSPKVLGELIELSPARRADGSSEATYFRVIGVMVPEVRGVFADEVDVWTPLEKTLPIVFGSNADYSQLPVRTLGRLRSGVSTQAVIREMDERFGDDAQQGPDTHFDAVKGIVPDIRVQREAMRQLRLFLAGSLMLALAAAANVSLFLLARSPGRQRELAIRQSVGAPMKRLAIQLAIEAGLLVLVSAILALLLITWLANVLSGMAFLRAADWGDVTLLDWRVLAVIGGFLGILTGLVSLAPIVGLRRFGMAASSRQVSARATPGQRVAGTAQVALAGTFAGAAVAFIWSLGPVLLGDPGYQTDNRQVAVLIPAFYTNPTLARPVGGIDEARQREAIESILGVGSVTLGGPIPSGQSGGLPKQRVLDPIDPSRQIEVDYTQIGAKFVDVLGLRLLYGREPTETEIGVALVNQALGRQLFGRDNVVGESLEVIGGTTSTVQIIGVLEDLSFGHPTATVEPTVFAQVPRQQLVFRAVIESPLPSNDLQQQLQRLHESGALDLQPNAVIPLAEYRDRDIAPDKARGVLTIGAACLVMLMTAFGFYGTQRYLVSAGRREFAIRAALGTGPTALGRLVLKQGIFLGLPGLVLGGFLAFIMVAWLRGDLISQEISPVSVTAAVLGGLIVLLLAASFGPASEARRTQPAPLLRED